MALNQIFQSGNYCSRRFDSDNWRIKCKSPNRAKPRRGSRYAGWSA